MATKKTTSRTTSPPSLLRRHKKLSIFLAVLVVVAVAGVGYNLTMDYLDKKRFETVSESIKLLQSKFKEELGYSSNWDYEANCVGSRTVKFDNLPPRCGVSTSSGPIRVSSTDEVEAIVERHDEIIFENPSIFEVTNDTEFEPIKFPQGLRSAEHYRYKGGGGSASRVFRESRTDMRCTIGYSMVTTNSLKVSLSCGDNARKEWY